MERKLSFCIECFSENQNNKMTTITSPTGTIQVKWDPKNLDIRTKSVEKTLEPLVTQVSAYAILYHLAKIFFHFITLYRALQDIQG